jgi:hypothetical protein
MKCNRLAFIQHLQRLSCGGQCSEVVFHGAFAADALVPDQKLFIRAPEVAGTAPLAEEVGVADLKLLIAALKLFPGEGNAGVEVEVAVRERRLVIDDGARGMQELVLSAPNTIATHVEAAIADKLASAGAGGAEAPLSIPLTRTLVEGVARVFALYRAEEIRLDVGPLSGMLRVGNDVSNRAKFLLPEAQGAVPYTLLFGRHLVDVFGAITDFGSAVLRLHGPQRPAVVTDGGFLYMLAPQGDSADSLHKGGGGGPATGRGHNLEMVDDPIAPV